MFDLSASVLNSNDPFDIGFGVSDEGLWVKSASRWGAGWYFMLDTTDPTSSFFVPASLTVPTKFHGTWSSLDSGHIVEISADQILSKEVVNGVDTNVVDIKQIFVDDRVQVFLNDESTDFGFLLSTSDGFSIKHQLNLPNTTLNMIVIHPDFEYEKSFERN